MRKDGRQFVLEIGSWWITIFPREIKQAGMLNYSIWIWIPGKAGTLRLNIRKLWQRDTSFWKQFKVLEINYPKSL